MARKKTKVYIAGPMTGYENYNFEAFNEAAEALRAEGYLVVNPAESHNGDQTLAWTDYLSWDLDQIRKVDAIVLLDGWQATDATGARLEIQYAMAHSIPVYEFDWDGADLLGERVDQWYENPRDFVKALNNGETFGWLDPRIDHTEPAKQSILLKAEGLVNGPRAAAYDHPTENFGRIVRLWNALLADKLHEPITEEEHAMMMIMVKMARLQATPEHEDSIIDIAGYAATYEKLVERRQEERQDDEYFSNIFQILQMIGGLRDEEESRA